MFKNVLMYRIGPEWSAALDAAEEALQAARFTPCGLSQEKAVGWVEPRGQDHGLLVESVGGQWIMKLMIESKVVPGSVVRRKVDEQVAKIEADTGRRPGKKERRDMADATRLALLPQAFSKVGSVWVWIDPAERWLVLDAASQGKADEVLTALAQSLEGFAVQAVQTTTSPATAMAHWLGEDGAPAGFSVDRECELRASDESRAVVRYSRHPLDIDEVRSHIALGKQPTRLALTWSERVSFVLTDTLVLKKLSFLEPVFEGSPKAAGDRADDHFDTDVAIATGELGALLTDLLAALGGEVRAPG